MAYSDGIWEGLPEDGGDDFDAEALERAIREQREREFAALRDLNAA